MTAVMVARRLSVGHGGHPILEGIDTYVEAGASVALVGPNGGGKSTLLRTMAGLIAPISGVLEILGASPAAQPSAIGYLGQHLKNDLALPLRAIDVVRMGRFNVERRFARRSNEDEQIVEAAMESLGIAAHAEAAMRDLSGGQRQRVAIAQVLARRAQLLLLDEPTNALDSVGRSLVLNALHAEQSRGAAVVMATHDVAEAARCDRVFLLSGTLVADGPPDEVLTADNLLETFGMSLARVGDRLVVTEHSHHHTH